MSASTTLATLEARSAPDSTLRERLEETLATLYEEREDHDAERARWEAQNDQLDHRISELEVQLEAQTEAKASKKGGRRRRAG